MICPECKKKITFVNVECIQNVNYTMEADGELENRYENKEDCFTYICPECADVISDDYDEIMEMMNDE